MEKTDKMIPPNISDIGQKDEDSGLRLFRGMMSPWDQIKSFKETYKFALRHAASYAICTMNAIAILEPDYEKRQTLFSDTWAEEMKMTWDAVDDPLGQVSEFEDRFQIPPFIKDGLYRVANFADKGDEMMLISGYIWQASDDRIEKEVYQCDLDIVGPDACDLSEGGGQYFCRGLAAKPMNNYLTERKGCGDPRCHVVWETKEKYGEHVNSEGYDWEQWGPPASGMCAEHKKHTIEEDDVDWLTSGEFIAALGEKWTAGEMYKDFCIWPVPYANFGVLAARKFVEEGKYTQEFIDNLFWKLFDASGKHMFVEKNAKKAAREWLGVPAHIEDSRVMGGYISMVFQAKSHPWKFIEFAEDRTVIEVDTTSLHVFGMFPEYAHFYEYYFNGMVKTLVNTEYVVRLEETDEGDTRYIIEKALYGFRRQKGDYKYDKGQLINNKKEE